MIFLLWVYIISSVVCVLSSVIGHSIKPCHKICLVLDIAVGLIPVVNTINAIGTLYSFCHKEERHSE